MSLFITFEGIEGCGKSTQLQLLARKLSAAGASVTVTREPGGCAIADQIRSILLDAGNSSLTPLAELFLYAAARAQHVAEVVKPALADGRIVLCDRFTDATIAYQGYGRGVSLDVIAQLHEQATAGTTPHLTVLLDCPVETGLKRAFARINTCDGPREERFELESMQFHQRVREGYLALAANDPQRFIIVDGDQTVEATEAAVTAAVLPKLGIR